MMIHDMALMVADVAANAEGPNLIHTSAILAVCSTLTGVVGWMMKGKQQQRSVRIEGTPGVRLQDAYVTRAEFAEFKAEIKTDVREMRGTFDKLAVIIDERDKRLTEMIERVAAGAYEGRRRLHENVNAHSAQLAVLTAKTDIARGLGSLGAAITKAIKSDTKTPP